MTKFQIDIPNDDCANCGAHFDEESKFDDYSNDMIKFIQNTDYLDNKNFLCSQCSKPMDAFPISMKHEDMCLTCNNDETIDYFCSKDCIIKFIESEINKKQQLNKDRNDLLEKFK